jgi:anti-anti-sigma factor
MGNDCDLITLVGDIDMTRVEDLRSAAEAFRDSTAVHAVVDLSDVTFFGSEAVGFVARLGLLARRQQGTVTLINASDAAVRVIDVCGLRKVVNQERRYSPAPERSWSAGESCGSAPNNAGTADHADRSIRLSVTRVVRAISPKELTTPSDTELAL